MNISYPIKNAALAVSGGSDSVFLTHLLLSFDNKLIDKSTAKIIHINHNWRGYESYKDQLFVKKLGQQFGVPVEVFQVHPDKDSKESPELMARNQRKEIFSKFSTVLTGHTADDLFETLLWKTLQGRDPGVGIKVQHENELRLLLQFTKEEMQSYLVEIEQSWREDLTNHDGVLLRSKMRKELLPTLTQVFPSSKMTVVKNSLEKQISDVVPESPKLSELDTLNKNMKLLEEAHSRFGFMVNELKPLVRKI